MQYYRAIDQRQHQRRRQGAQEVCRRLGFLGTEDQHQKERVEGLGETLVEVAALDPPPWRVEGYSSIMYRVAAPTARTVTRSTVCRSGSVRVVEKPRLRKRACCATTLTRLRKGYLFPVSSDLSADPRPWQFSGAPPGAVSNAGFREPVRASKAADHDDGRHSLRSPHSRPPPPGSTASPHPTRDVAARRPSKISCRIALSATYNVDIDVNNASLLDEEPKPQKAGATGCLRSTRGRV